MFPTFISIIDIQSWWEVPSISHFCSLFRTAFNLLDFDIEDLEEALLTDGTEEPSWLQELIVRILSGCLPNNEISTFNYQMFLRRLFRQKCQEHDRYNPFNTDIDFQFLPLRTKVDILHALCDFRLDAEDVFDKLKNLEADSLRVEPLGYDSNESAYWYFYGTRLYREDGQTKINKKSVWQVICFTEDDWYQLTKKFKKSTHKQEKQLYHTLSENFLPELPRLFKEKENLARKRLLENLPRRTSTRLRKLENEAEKVLIKKAQKDGQDEVKQQNQQKDSDENKKKDLERRRKEAYERRAKLKEQSEEGSLSDCSVDRDEMAGYKSRKSKGRQRKMSSSSSASKDNVSKPPKKSKKNQKELETISKSAISTTTVGRQTNNSLSAATGQILIQQPPNSNKKRIKTSVVFRQTDEDLQTGMHKILDYMKNHEDAWPFVDPVEEEYAPNYYSIIRKPMDLQRMEERLDSGYYKTFAKFRSDFQLIVDNCRLYNGVENEYTEMVDTLLKAFERVTIKYLDMISSSDDEIAIEYSTTESEKKCKKKHDEYLKSQLNSRRKPMLAAQTDKKRERSVSETSENSRKSCDSNDVNSVQTKSEKTVKKTKKSLKSKNLKSTKKQNSNVKIDKVTKEKKKEEHDIKKSKKEKSANKSIHLTKNITKKFSKKEKNNAVPSRCDVTICVCKSPFRSDLSSSSSFSCPSSPEGKFLFSSKEKKRKRSFQNLNDSEDSYKGKMSKLSKFGSDNDFTFTNEEKIADYLIGLSAKPKDKHNKLRETIEKLKAKSEMMLNDEFDFKIELGKENKDKIIRQENELENKSSSRVKEKSHSTQLIKSDIYLEVDGNNTTDSTDSKNVKKLISKANVQPSKSSNLDALTLATEETLKDINKWLDDTPKFSEFSSTSNSPSYTGGEDLDIIPGKVEQATVKKIDKPISTKKEASVKESNKKRRDTSKFFKKREVQRTIDRLQPGKSKGNLISNVQNSNKVDEMFPLGPLTKIKDTKNSLIVKTDTNAPKLNLGSVLDSFGKHNFVDDHKKEEQKILAEIPKENSSLNFIDGGKQEIVIDTVTKDNKEDHKETESIKDDTISTEGATPNLSAWFKAFGAPKVQTVQKKNDIKPDGKENEKIGEGTSKISKVPTPTASSNIDSLNMPHGQLMPRQRRISTGSSMSERSSFSQDMDSPRVGMDERGAYPAPYPSPMHRSPSGASPIMASPRPDISPKAAAYPTISGQIRCGFYQDTVSNKSSPDKSCSPKETLQSPYPHYSEHVYTPNTENSYYSYANSPYYTHAPNYSSTNPTPPYSMEGSSSYYDTTKTLNEQHQTKNTPNYTTNSPASNHSSPVHPHHSPSLVISPHSPNVHSPNVLSPHSPNILSPHSPNVLSPHSSNVLSPHSPNVLSPHSPNVLSPHSPNIHSPNVHSPHSSNIHSPNIHSQQPPNISQHCPSVPQQSPNVSQHSPNFSQHSPNVSQHSPNVSQHSSNIQFQNSPTFHSQQTSHSQSTSEFNSRRSPGLHSPANSLSVLSHDSSRSAVQSELSSLQNSGNLQIPNSNVQSSPSPKLQQNQPESEIYQKSNQNEIPDRISQHSGQQSAMFPVKKRVYSDHESSQMNTQDYEIELKAVHSASVSVASENSPNVLGKSYKTHQNQHNQNNSLLEMRESLHSKSISSPLPQCAPQTSAETMNNILDTKLSSSFVVPYNREVNCHLNIPTTAIPSTQSNMIEMSKYTNMGYTGPEVSFTKSGLQANRNESSTGNSLLEATFKSSTSIQVTASASQLLSQPMDISRLCTSNSTSPSQRFKVLEGDTNHVSPQQSLGNFSSSSRTADLSNQNIASGYVTDVTASRPNYNSQTIDVEQPIGLGRNISSFSHLVDRYSSEERLLAGLQSSSTFYTDKGLGTSQLFNKPVGTNTPSLPIFNQADMAAMQQCYNQSIQSSRSIYSRPMTGIQNSTSIQSDQKTSLPSQVQEKKKKRKCSKVVPASEAQSSVPHQGFQSYAGLKGSASVEPSAISLKTSSVVPGSAFNFGPTPTSLGINPSLYSDKEAYPNFLEEFRSAPNYYMAAAAHHRSKTEVSSEKQTRVAHQSSNPQSAPGYSFLGATPPTRPTYPIGGPFITNAAQAAQLMDTSSPLYQHYLQAGVLNQGLLGPPGAYPPGYHPALSIRQPYDSMTRPPWL